MSEERRPGPLRTGSAVLVVAVALMATPLTYVLQLSSGTFDIGSLATTGLLYALLGAVVLVRRPENPLGFVLVVIGATSVLGGLSEAVTTSAHGASGRPLPGVVWAGWFGDWYWLVSIWLQFVALPLLFPDGRPPSRSWRRFGIVAAVLAGGCLVLAIGGREIVLDGIQLGRAADDPAVVTLANPVAFVPIGNFERDVGVLVLLLPPFAVGAVASLVQRFRRSVGVVRQQLRVAVAGIGFAGVGFGLGALLDLVGVGLFNVLGLLIIFIAPVSLGVAILRYRLYELDRIISRTVSWTVVSLVLVAVYLGGVVVLQSFLRPLTGEGDLPVALSTLAAAAIARPLLRRVQAVVDRRFNRAHYDAARVVDEFARSLRDQVSRDAVVGGLREASVRTFGAGSVDVVLLDRPQT